MRLIHKLLQILFRRSGSDEGQSVPFMDPQKAKELGYVVTPAGFQWSPGPRNPVDKSRWKPCPACGRLIPINAPHYGNVSQEEFRKAWPSLSYPNATVKEERNNNSNEIGERPITWTYVCPFCRFCHVETQVGRNSHVETQTPFHSPDIPEQTMCHDCGTSLGGAYQCPKCSLPKGWMTVPCPYCGNRQPVDAPHMVIGCDVFMLECVNCESLFNSFCIC